GFVGLDVAREGRKPKFARQGHKRILGVCCERTPPYGREKFPTKGFTRFVTAEFALLDASRDPGRGKGAVALPVHRQARAVERWAPSRGRQSCRIPRGNPHDPRGTRP